MKAETDETLVEASGNCGEPTSNRQSKGGRSCSGKLAVAIDSGVIGCTGCANGRQRQRHPHAEAALAPKGDEPMLHYAVVFFIIALIAALFGFTGLAGAAAGIAQILFVVFLILFIVSLLVGRRRPLL
jgi:uncharacterized membrane protein YtjA (UPF0391 family)